MAQSADAQPDASPAKAARPWPTWLVRAFALLLLVAACVAAYHFGSRQATPVEERLYVDPKYLDFGEVWENPKFEWVLPIENRGNSDVEVSQVRSSCTCLLIEPSAFRICPGETATIRLKLDLTYRPPRKASSTAREGSGFRAWHGDECLRAFELPVAFCNENGFEYEAFALQGKVRSAIILNPTVLSFGDLQIDKPFPSKSVAVELCVPGLRLEASCDRSIGRVCLSPPTRDDGSLALEITPSKDLQAGPFSFDAMVYPVGRDGKRLPGLPVRVSGTLCEDLVVSPSSLFFGARLVGEVVEDTVTMSSVSGTRFDVLEWRSDSEAVSVESLPSPGDVRHFRIVCRIMKSGYRKTQVAFVVNTPSDTRKTIKLDVSSCGLSPSSQGETP